MFLPYLGIGAILVRGPGPFEQIFLLPLSEGCICNLIEIDPAVSEKKFENGGRSDDGRRRRYPISSPGDFGFGELKSDKVQPAYSQSLGLKNELHTPSSEYACLI